MIYLNLLVYAFHTIYVLILHFDCQLDGRSLAVKRQLNKFNKFNVQVIIFRLRLGHFSIKEMKKKESYFPPQAFASLMFRTCLVQYFICLENKWRLY